MRLPSIVSAVNIGLPLFQTSLQDQAVPVTGIDWQIPARGDERLIAILERLFGPKAKRIDAANADVLARLDKSRPMLTTVALARKVIPSLDERVLLHPGPSIDPARFCGPLSRAVRAAILAEGWAADAAGAACLLETSEVRLEPANAHSAVLPMASVIGPSSPVYVVENEAGGPPAFAALNQGPGPVQWVGVDTAEAIDRLCFLRDVLAPVLAEALARTGPLDIMALAAQGLAMGDDVHIRVQATTNLFIRDLLPGLVACRHSGLDATARFLTGNHLTFLNIAMAGARAIMNAASGVEGSSIVTTMARNGSTYGIRLSGAASPWFVCTAPPVGQALYRPGFGPKDAALDIGDSAILELVGLGAAAAANSPAVAAALGGRMADAEAITQRMRRIAAGTSSRLRLPFMDNAGTPLGIDVRRVVEQSTTPAVTTGIVHETEAIGQIGAGLATAPLDCFVEALIDLDTRIP